MSILFLLQRGGEWSARAVLIGTAGVAPFLIGSVPAQYQLWLSYGVILSFLFWMVSTGIRVASQSAPEKIVVPAPVFLLGLLILVGVAQLRISKPFPAQLSASNPWSHELDQIGITSSHSDASNVVSQAPFLTRFQVARLIIIVVTAFLAAQLFRTSRHFLYLFGALAAVGAMFALFGISQKLTWNGLLLGSIPLRYGGDPFGTFVNRNNAAGFLNICLSAGLGGLILSSEAQSRENTHSAAIVFTVLIILIGAGVTASASRGGIVSACAGLVVVAPFLIKRFGRRTWVGISVGGLAVLLLGTWLHFGEIAVKRLDSLHNVPGAFQGRWQHWSDTARALSDRPWLGSGWGTYRYVNLPYQQHETNTWFWNADNQFFEIAVEGGLVTVLIIAGFLITFTMILIYLAIKGETNLDCALTTCGLFLLVSIGAQATTDFGITLMALGLAGSILMGAISAAVSIPARSSQRGGFQSFPGASCFPRIPGAGVVTSLMMVFLLGGTTWAGMELTRSQPGMTFREQLPVNLDAPDLFIPGQLDDQIEQGRMLSRRTPDDAELQLALARLLIYRYQQGAVDSAILPAGSSPERQAAWERFRLENLFWQSRLTIGPERLAETRQTSYVRDNLPEAIQDLQAAQAACKWLPGVGSRLVLLSALNFPASESDSPAELLRQEALLNAGNPARLINLGSISLEYHADELAVLCWRRVIALNPKLLPKVVQAARLGLEDDQISVSLFSSAEQLVAFSRMTHDLSATQAIVNRLEVFRMDLQRAHGSEMTGQAAWISAQIALLANQRNRAIKHLQQAVKYEPFQTAWRLELANLLIQQGDDPQAREQLTFASRLDPENREIKKRLEEVVGRELRKRTPDREIISSPGRLINLSLPPETILSISHLVIPTFGSPREFH